MSESLEELKAIIDNAPEGKTHVCVENGYQGYWNDDDCDCLAISGDGVYLSGMRSLSDIKRIIELMELLEDVSALGFLEVAHDSGKSHRDVCGKAKLILGDL